MVEGGDTLYRIGSLMSHYPGVDVVQEPVRIRHLGYLLVIGAIQLLEFLLAVLERLRVEPFIHTLFCDSHHFIQCPPSEPEGSPPYSGSEGEFVDLLFPIHLLVLSLAREGLTEDSQDVDVVVLVDAQPRHILLQVRAQMGKP